MPAGSSTLAPDRGGRARRRERHRGGARAARRKAHLSHGHDRAATSCVSDQSPGTAPPRGGRTAARRTGESAAPATGAGASAVAPLMRLLAGVADQGDLVRVGDRTLSAEQLLACAAAV